ANPAIAGIPTRYESMVSASLMPAVSPQPSTSVLHGMKAFALSTMGRSRATGVDHPHNPSAHSSPTETPPPPRRPSQSPALPPCSRLGESAELFPRRKKISQGLT